MPWKNSALAAREVGILGLCMVQKGGKSAGYGGNVPESAGQ